MSPCALTLLANLTEYFSVFVSVNVCVPNCLFLTVCVCVCVRDLDTELHKRDPCAPPDPLLNNLTPCRHYGDDRGKMFAPGDAMEKASRPHLTDGAKCAHADKRAHVHAHSHKGRTTGKQT